MNEQVINIVYTPTDDNYIGIVVSMCSVLKNNPKNKINFYMLIDENFNNEFEKYFETYKQYPNCENVIFKTVNSLKYKQISSMLCFSNEIYLFEIADLTDADKILYLKPYSIVTTDLTELFNIDLSDYSCTATEYLFPEYLKSDYFNINKIPNECHSLLINTKKWKEKQYLDKLFDKQQWMSVFKDSPSFNTFFLFNVIVDDCKTIDLKYSFTHYWYVLIKITCSDKTKDDYKKYKQQLDIPSVIILSGESPLSCKNDTYTNLWWSYAEKSPIYEEIKQYREINQYKLSATAAKDSFNYGWLLSRMWPYIKPYWFRILIGFAISIPLGLLDGVTALALKPYMDYVIGGKTFELSILGHSLSITSLLMAILIPVGIILFAGIQGVLRYLNSYITSWTSMNMTNDVKLDLFHRLIHMHPQFFDDNPSGIVISRYVGDPSTASSGIVSQIKTITTSVFGAFGLIAVMIYSSWQLAFIGVIVLCMAFLPITLLRKRMRMASNKNMVISGDITTNMNETYNGNKVMYAYDLQNIRENTFKSQIKEAFNVNISLTKRTAWMSPMMYMIASCGIATVLGVGTYLINTHQMTAGSFASFVTSLLLLYKPVKTLGNTLTSIQNIFVAMGRVFELFDLEPQIKDREKTVEFTELKEKITFEDVCFEYVPNKPVLKHINLEIPKNETLAIVGNSGGGKSTLVNLINRFYEVKSGAVKYDETDIRDFSLKSLRGSISMVFQDNFLYSGTIKENILMGKPDATVEELEHAIDFAHLNEMIEKLPEGLETIIGERGLTLSGGQRQRVAIARAILRNAPIVILDEATSALDNESEAIVQKAMDNLMKNRTVFIIAHRLSTIKNADRIAVINEGELAELGTHEELMQIDNGQYKHLYEMQFRQQEKTLCKSV